MPITLELLEADHALLLTFHDPWTLIELNEQYKQMDIIFHKASQKLDTIVDMSDVHKFPSSILSARLRSPVVNHPNSGNLLMVSTHSMTKSLVNVASRLARFNRVYFFDTRELALIHLRKK